MNQIERVITREMEKYFTKKSEILVKVGESEAYLLCPTDVTGMVVALTKNECYPEEHRRFAIVNKARKFGGRRDAIMRGRMETDYQELLEIIGYMNIVSEDRISAEELDFSRNGSK